MDKQQARAEELFGEVFDLPQEQRGTFLDLACRDAPELRRVVEGLLAENDRRSGFLSSPAYVMPDETLAESTTTSSLKVGQRLGRYLILEPLGSGGMGVVFRARDDKLERMVAIKVLATGLLGGEKARRQFRQEALALAKLNHPRIAAVYDVGEQDGADFIVMELVEGESLAVKLRAVALGVQEVTAITLQIAEALEEAHAHGVIHRDLRPGNVMITPKGDAKILDFGLATLLASQPEAVTSFAPTGGLFGTPLYMSPEQALGRKVDARTDLGVSASDGRMLAFIRGDEAFMGAGQIYVKLLPGGEPVPLTHDSRFKLAPSFSPDNSRIAYGVAGPWETWEVPVLGGGRTIHNPNSSSLTWIEGGRRLLFSEIKKGLHMAVVTTDEGRGDSCDVYVPPAGFANVEEVPNAKSSAAIPWEVDSAVSPSVYAYSRVITRRNLYRIRLP